MLATISGIITIIAGVLMWYLDKRKIDAAYAQAIIKGLEDANKAIKLANDARRTANDISMSDDPFNRDRE